MKKKSKSNANSESSDSTAIKKAQLKATNLAFPIVGIGSSAGGLEALEQFFEHTPIDSGMAFVVVQHLDPRHKGMMPELLQHKTGMKVFQVKDRMTVEPNCIYVIPPNKDMSILHGVLHLLPPVEPRGLRLPIDFFLRSLAQDQMEHSVGVILSGMGSDGTLGLRAIKEKAGLVLAQDPSTSKCDSMPRSAIDAELVDLVAPAEELPQKIIALLKRTTASSSGLTPMEAQAKNALDKVIVLLRAHTNQDFSLYKKNTLYRRVERRMVVHHIEKMSDYVQYLQENTQELDILFKELLIGVTKFFRNSEVWEQLRSHVLPELLANQPAGQVLRAWLPGCSSGEEAYSLAIVFAEVVEQMHLKKNISIQIFATDLDDRAIEKARQGVFLPGISADVSERQLKHFFTKEDAGYRVCKNIREMVVFAQQNIIMDPPFTKLDILICRNLLIYLTAEVQKKLIPLFHYSLNPSGILILGNSETIGGYTRLFKPVDKKARIFRRSEASLTSHPVEFPSSFTASHSPLGEKPSVVSTGSSLQTMADQLILRRIAPAAVLTNDKGDICYINGRTGKYLEPAAGKANWNLFAMLRAGLRHEISAAFQQVLRKKECVVLQGLKVQNGDEFQLVNTSIEQLDEPEPLNGLMMVVIKDVTQDRKDTELPKTAANPREANLEQELIRARAEARSLQEERQTSQEEFRSANEELQSTNEELQSTNEELTTSKEEMQSLNEELQTVNAELQSKVEELSRVSNDMKNLLNSTDIATLFLDSDNHVRQYTSQMTKIINFIPADIGRLITDLALDLNYPDLSTDTQEVLRTLIPIEKPIDSKDGRCFSIRIMPYRTLDNRIDGTVITFSDITTAKNLETKLLRRNADLEKRAENKPNRK